MRQSIAHRLRGISPLWHPGDRQRPWEWLLLIGLLTLALLARVVPGERIVDDAYITFRYARNIAEGRGFVYNPGEHVLGTTTPLYTLLLAAVAVVSGSRDFATIAVAINAVAGAAAVGLLYALGRQITKHWAPAAAVALLWAVAPYSVTFAIGGMETDLTVALLLAVSCMHLSARPRWMAAFSALAFLARPDTVILLGLLWLDRILVRRQVPGGDAIPWQEGAIGLAILAPWLAFATLTFGSPIPGSVAAKSATYRLFPGESLIRLIQHYGTPFFGHNVLGSSWQLAAFVFYLLLCAMGGLRGVRQDRRAWPLLAYPFVYFAVFSAANPLLFRWYLSPPLPFYVLFIVTGVWALGHNLDRLVGGSTLSPPKNDGSTSRPTCQPIVLILFTTLALAFTLNAWELHPDHGPDRPAPEMAWFELELLYARTADIVLDHAGPDDTLCAGDIGTLGYVTDLPILDTVGLVTPESRRYYPAAPGLYVTNYAIPADLVLSLDPDFIVILEVYGRRGLLPDEAFQDHYRLLRKIETDIYGSDGMLIYVGTR
jgi:hypothetical protein